MGIAEYQIGPTLKLKSCEHRSDLATATRLRGRTSGHLRSQQKTPAAEDGVTAEEHADKIKK